MENLFLPLLFVFANLLVRTTTASQINIESPPPTKHVPLFIFGDSLFDTGNNNYLKNGAKANFFPYGESFFKSPTGRFSDGRIIPDFIAEYMKLPGYVSPYLQPGNSNYTNGVDFASGAAGALTETFKGKTIDLKSQAGYFKKVTMQLRKRFGAKTTDKLLSKAIFLINIGINDYNWLQFERNSSCFNALVCKKEYVKMVVSNISVVLQEIYEKGGRKFAMSNVAPLGCLPHSRAANHGECLNQVSSVVKMHNIQLELLLKSLQIELQHFQYLYFNLHDSLTQRILYPSSYGFNEVKAACCGVGPYRGMGKCGKKGKQGENTYCELCEDLNKYLFFDGHSTQKANKQLAQLLWSGKNKIFIRPNNLRHFSHVHPKEFKKI
ncbi:GDSL lipase [Euphorbia peplus]|nr:GDSL lipase [Euphorbia peplus]